MTADIQIAIGDREADGRPEIVVNAGGFGRSPELAVVQFDGEQNLTEIQRFEYESEEVFRSRCDLWLTDLDGVAGDEIFIDCGIHREVFWPDPMGVYEIQPQTLEPSSQDLYPTGDLNGDTIVDWFLEESESSLSPTVFFGPIMLDRNLNLGTDNEYSGNLAETAPSRAIYGDLDGNGIDDALLLDGDDTTFSRLLLYGQPETTPVMEAVVHTRSDFPADPIYFTVDLGDVNADGWPDFGFAHGVLIPENNVLEIYFGSAALSETPDLTIGRANHEISSVAAGDFNGDGVSDIVVGYDSETVADGAFELYAGGIDFDDIPDQSWPYSAFKDPAEEVRSGNVTNAGDINGDLVDDLLVALPRITNGYILFGGEEIAPTPDVELEYDFGTTVGMNLLGLGDLNDDGFDDLAVTDGFGRANTGGVIGTVYIHLGSASSSQLATPDFILNPLLRDGLDQDLFGMKTAAGDYDGDGYLDLVIGSSSHAEGFGIGNEEQGIEAVTVYYGGPTFDDQPDLFLRLPRSFFGLELPGYLNFSIGEFTFLPDLNADGKQELLIGSFDARNRDIGSVPDAIILPGGAEEDTAPLFVLQGPNRFVGTGSYINNIYRTLHHSAINDYDQDGMLDVLLPQYHDNNDGVRSSRVYRFALPQGTDVANTDETRSFPSTFALHQNYPNPFSDQTTIAYSIPTQAHVRITVFDLLGREITRLVDRHHLPGRHTVLFKPQSLSNGVVAVLLEADGKRWTRQMVVLK